MSSIEFTRNDSPTVGVEIELCSKLLDNMFGTVEVCVCAMATRPTGAERQVALYKETADLTEVIRRSLAKTAGEL